MENDEFIFKVAFLLGRLDDFLIRVEDRSIQDSDCDSIRTLVKDVKKKFFDNQKKQTA